MRPDERSVRDERMLDVGCGSGDVLRAVVKVYPFKSLRTHFRVLARR